MPQDVKHRLENFTESDVEIVEIQCGQYLDEGDIVRYDDACFRI